MKNITFTLIMVVLLNANTLFPQPIMIWDEVYSLTNLQDQPIKIIIDDSSNIFIIGYSAISNYPQTNFDALILKYNEHGILQWSRKHSLSNFGSDYFANLIKCDSGKVLVTGSMQTSNGLVGLNILYGAYGDTIWIKDFNFSFSYLNQIHRTSSQKYFIVDKNDAGNGLIIISYDEDGSNENIKYTNEISGIIKGIKLIEECDSIYVLTSYTRTDSSNRFIPVIAKYSINGNLIWESSLIDTTVNLIIPSFITDDSSNTYVLIHENNLHFDKLYLSKISNSGQPLWNRTFNVSTTESFESSSILKKNDGTIYIVGEYTKWSSGSGEKQVFFLKYDNNGKLINYVKKELSESIYSVKKATSDNSDNLYVLITSQSLNWLFNFHVAKFNLSDEFEYEIIYDYQNLTTHNEEPVDFVLINENDFVITGRYSSPGQITKILTTRYSDQTTSLSEFQILKEYNIYQNYPNPFNPSTMIRYQIPDAGLVILKLYDVLGREVTTLVNEFKPAGRYEIQFDGSNYASGVYFYQIKAGDYLDTKKMIFLK
jgi:hypothetical protein